MEPIKLLKSQNAVIVVLVVALLAQMPHAQAVFYDNGHTQNLLGLVFSIFAAVALEIAVLVFVVRGNVHASWGFALFSIAINLVYYADAQAAWYLPNPSWLLSAGLPIAIALYSHEVAEPLHEEKPLHETISLIATVATPAIADTHGVAMVDPKVRAVQLKSEGLSNARIAKELQVNASTVGRWFKELA